MAQNKILNVQSVAVPTAIGNILNCGLFLPAPNQNALATAGGGSLGAATYFYKVTALVNRLDGTTGETSPSNEQSIATGASGTNTVTWGAVAGATGYRIYRGTASNGENVYYQVGAVTTFADTGAASTGGSPPAINTALPIFVQGPTGLNMTQPYVIIKHIRAVNRTGSPIAITLYKGASGAQVNGTEYAFANDSIGANSFQDSYTQSRFDAGDFLTGIAAGAGVVLNIDAEIGVS